MSSDGTLEIWAIIGFGLGLVSFFKGFKVYREYRILSDTPEIPVRSVAMGLVHIHGKAQGDQLVTSPVTQTPSYFYKVDIERYERDSKGNGSWQHQGTDLTGVPFYLEDATGKVLLDPHNAEYDLLETCKRKTGGAFGQNLTTIFTGTKNPPLNTGQGIDDGALISYAQSIASGGGRSISTRLSSISFSFSGGMQNRNWGLGSSGQYRFTEYCILKDHWYDVTGTCVENPNPADEHDRNLIMKGQNEPTFLISWRAEKAIESKLRNRAALYIFGGGALSIVCLGVLLAQFGWL